MCNIRKVANVFDRDLGRAYEVFEFSTIGRDIRQIQIDRAQSRDVKAVSRALVRANANLSAELD